LSPHFLVFAVRERGAAPSGGKSLAIGAASTPVLLPEQIGRMPQVEATSAAVREAMKRAAIADDADVHWVQIKCPLLTSERMADAASRGAATATDNTYASMALSRGASALGAALALGEVDPVTGRSGATSACGRRVPAPRPVSNSCTAKSSSSATAPRGQATMSSPMG
jgi:cyanuric acid amidohydrolase